MSFNKDTARIRKTYVFKAIQWIILRISFYRRKGWVRWIVLISTQKYLNIDK